MDSVKKSIISINPKIYDCKIVENQDFGFIVKVIYYNNTLKQNNFVIKGNTVLEVQEKVKSTIIKELNK